MPRSLWQIRVEILLFVGILLFGVVLVVSSSGVSQSDWRHGKARLYCSELSRAIESYMDAPANTKHEPPRTLNDLIQPPWGGQSLLQDGAKALTDPWGKPFQMEVIKRADGTGYILVFTTAPDGTPTSQFGIGPNAAPRLE
jgi:general secretion pathway protein G